MNNGSHPSKSKGYPTSVVMQLLDVGPTTLKYWRKHLDPSPEGRSFNGSYLLSYRVLKALIRDRHIPVDVLKNCSLDPIFSIDSNSDIDGLKHMWIVLRERAGTVEIHPGPPVDLAEQPQDMFSMRLEPVIDQHLHALFSYGE